MESESIMKIGIFGGSFNPVHLGHFQMIKTVFEKMKLDKIIIVPVGVPSHRENNLIEGKNRLEMCRLAFQEMEKVEVSDIEIENKERSYTYDTLMKLKVNHLNAEFYEIIGEDSANYFIQWKNYEEILKNSKVIVLKRKNEKQIEKKSSLELEKIKKDFIYLENKYFDYSSTKIRKTIKLGESVRGMMPNLVEKYIKDNNLYDKN